MIDFNDHALLLNGSYQHWFGEPLVVESDPGRLLEAINAAEFVVFSHGNEADPIFNYGNLKALSLFQMPFQEFIQLPSRESAPPEHRNARSDLFRQVEAKGYITNYSGERVSAKGRKFQIQDGVVWQLIDPLGRIHGHAARFEMPETFIEAR